MLVVEVTEGPNDKDFSRNVRLYQRVPSIREYWVVHYGQSDEAFFFRAFRKRNGHWAKPATTLLLGDNYSTPPLPGFTLKLEPR